MAKLKKSTRFHFTNDCLSLFIEQVIKINRILHLLRPKKKTAHLFHRLAILADFTILNDMFIHFHATLIFHGSNSMQTSKVRRIKTEVSTERWC